MSDIEASTQKSLQQLTIANPDAGGSSADLVNIHTLKAAESLSREGAIPAATVATQSVSHSAPQSAAQSALQSATQSASQSATQPAIPVLVKVSTTASHSFEPQLYDAKLSKAAAMDITTASATPASMATPAQLLSEKSAEGFSQPALGQSASVPSTIPLSAPLPSTSLPSASLPSTIPLSTTLPSTSLPDKPVQHAPVAAFPLPANHSSTHSSAAYCPPQPLQTPSACTVGPAALCPPVSTPLHSVVSSPTSVSAGMAAAPVSIPLHPATSTALPGNNTVSMMNSAPASFPATAVTSAAPAVNNSMKGPAHPTNPGVSAVPAVSDSMKGSIHPTNPCVSAALAVDNSMKGPIHPTTPHQVPVAPGSSGLPSPLFSTNPPLPLSVPRLPLGPISSAPIPALPVCSSSTRTGASVGTLKPTGFIRPPISLPVPQPSLGTNFTGGQVPHTNTHTSQYVGTLRARTPAPPPLTIPSPTKTLSSSSQSMAMPSHNTQTPTSLPTTAGLPSSSPLTPQPFTPSSAAVMSQGTQLHHTNSQPSQPVVNNNPSFYTGARQQQHYVAGQPMLTPVSQRNVQYPPLSSPQPYIPPVSTPVAQPNMPTTPISGPMSNTVPASTAGSLTMSALPLSMPVSAASTALQQAVSKTNISLQSPTLSKPGMGPMPVPISSPPSSGQPPSLGHPPAPITPAPLGPRPYQPMSRTPPPPPLATQAGVPSTIRPHGSLSISTSRPMQRSAATLPAVQGVNTSGIPAQLVSMPMAAAPGQITTAATTLRGSVAAMPFTAAPTQAYTGAATYPKNAAPTPMTAAATYPSATTSTPMTAAVTHPSATTSTPMTAAVTHPSATTSTPMAAATTHPGATASTAMTSAAKHLVNNSQAVTAAATGFRASQAPMPATATPVQMNATLVAAAGPTSSGSRYVEAATAVTAGVRPPTAWPAVGRPSAAQGFPAATGAAGLKSLPVAHTQQAQSGSSPARPAAPPQNPTAPAQSAGSQNPTAPPQTAAPQNPARVPQTALPQNPTARACNQPAVSEAPVASSAPTAGPLAHIKSSHSLNSLNPQATTHTLLPSSSITTPGAIPVKSEDNTNNAGSSDFDSDFDPDDDDLLECDESLPGCNQGSEGDNRISGQHGSAGRGNGGADAGGENANHETESVNDRLERRRKSNRESARRMRQARAERMSKLQAELTALRTKKVQLLEQQMELQQDCEEAMQENKDLWQHLMRLKMHTPFARDGHEDGVEFDRRYPAGHTPRGFGAHERGSNEDDTIAFPGLKRPPTGRDYGPPTKRRMNSSSSVEDMPYPAGYAQAGLYRSKSEGLIRSNTGYTQGRGYDEHHTGHLGSSLSDQPCPVHSAAHGQPSPNSLMSRPSERSNAANIFSPVSPLPGRTKEYRDVSPAPKASFPPKPLFPHRSSTHSTTPESKLGHYGKEYADVRSDGPPRRAGGQLVHRTLISPKGPRHAPGSLSSPPDPTPATPSNPASSAGMALPPSPFSLSSNPKDPAPATSQYPTSEVANTHTATPTTLRKAPPPMRLKGSTPSTAGNTTPPPARETYPALYPAPSAKGEALLPSQRSAPTSAQYPPRMPPPTRGAYYADAAYHPAARYPMDPTRSRSLALHRSSSLPSLRQTYSDPYATHAERQDHGLRRPSAARALEFSAPSRYPLVDSEAGERRDYGSPGSRWSGGMQGMHGSGMHGSGVQHVQDEYYEYAPHGHPGMVHSRSHTALQEYSSRYPPRSPRGDLGRYGGHPEDAAYGEPAAGRRSDHSPHEEAFAALEQLEREVEHDIRQRLAPMAGRESLEGLDPELQNDINTSIMGFDTADREVGSDSRRMLPPAAGRAGMGAELQNEINASITGYDTPHGMDYAMDPGHNVTGRTSGSPQIYRDNHMQHGYGRAEGGSPGHYPATVHPQHRPLGDLPMNELRGSDKQYYSNEQHHSNKLHHSGELHRSNELQHSSGVLMPSNMTAPHDSGMVGGDNKDSVMYMGGRSGSGGIKGVFTPESEVSIFVDAMGARPTFEQSLALHDTNKGAFQMSMFDQEEKTAGAAKGTVPNFSTADPNFSTVGPNFSTVGQGNRNPDCSPAQGFTSPDYSMSNNPVIKLSNDTTEDRTPDLAGTPADEFLMHEPHGSIDFPPLPCWDHAHMHTPGTPVPPLSTGSPVGTGPAPSTPMTALLAESTSGTMSTVDALTREPAPSPHGCMDSQGLFPTGDYLNTLGDLDMSQCEELLRGGEGEGCEWQKLLGDDLLDLGS